MHAKMIGGRRPLVPEILSQSDRIGAKFEQLNCDNSETGRDRMSGLLLLARTITHPAVRSLCDSWASCFFC